jgi:ribosomal protein L10
MGKTILDALASRLSPTLPSLDELRGKIIGLLQAPATKIAGVLQAPAVSSPACSGPMPPRRREGGVN